ncbi:Clp protease N-terminal domain-containing protein [Actinokineospora sp.]|uniref:ClpX C4-type zinc finger protein n=1 Tax=Actinokineospora sp. TaxID=1872133 RepID=UPI003D6BB502
MEALAAASAVQRELGDVADQVMEHFVVAARRAGLSWTSIGERLGVSMQAARQRFGDRPLTVLGGELEIRPRLQVCLDQAREAGARDGVDEIDSQYLLLGLLHVGVAAAALDRLGVTRERVIESSGRLFGPVVSSGTVEPGWTPDAEEAIQRARGLARERGHGYVGTEHLLLVLATDPGSQARRVLQDLGVGVADIKRELEDVVCPAPSRRRRRRHRDAQPSCSFCGKATPSVRLVGGPGVCICESCVRGAVDELSAGGLIVDVAGPSR